MIIKGIVLSLVFPFVFGACKSEPDYDNAWSREIDNVIYKFDGENVTADLENSAEEIRIVPYVVLKGEERPVTRIADYAFYYRNIQRLYLPSTLKEIGESAFENADIKELYLENIEPWCEINLALNSSDLSLVWPAIYNASTSANPIGAGTRVYVNGSPLGDLDIPGNVKKINDFVFMNLHCGKINIAEGVEKIGAYAFANTVTDEINLPSSIKEIDPEAFSMCKGGDVLNIPENLVKVGGGAFPPTISKFYVSSLGKWLEIYYDCSYTHNGNIELIYPFQIPYDLIINGSPAEDVTIPSDVNKINQLAFLYSNIKSLNCEEGLKTIDSQALINCKELESVYLPSTIEEVSCNFQGCDNLKKIEIRSKIPPMVNTFVFANYLHIDTNVASNCTLYVPQESVEMYRNDEWWGYIKNIVGI